MRLEKDNCKLLSLYMDGNYSSVLDDKNKMLFILRTTKLESENVIAFFDNKDVCTICNVNECNSFLLSTLDISQELSEQQLKQKFTEFFENDLNKLIEFNDRQLGDSLSLAISCIVQPAFDKLIKGLNKFDLTNVPYFEAKSLRQVHTLLTRKIFYICISSYNNRFDLANTSFTKVVKNGSCGSWKTLLQQEGSHIFFFDKLDEPKINDNFITVLKSDLEKTPYEVANRLLKLEDIFTKSITKAIDSVTSISGFIPMDKIRYPRIDKLAESIAKEIRNCQKNNKELTEELLTEFKKLYSEVDLQIQNAKETLKYLYAKSGVKNGTIELR